MTILCLASYEKGHEFLRECKRQGCRVLLLTSLSLKDKARWPRDSIDDIFYMPDEDHRWHPEHTRNAVSHLARKEYIERLVPLDDFDLEMAASLREHLRIPGMGETTTRHFRDKLAMRTVARDAGLPVPEFVGVINDGRIADFLQQAPRPWVLKPRSLAGALGIKKIHTADEFWSHTERLGDDRSNYLLERFVPGDVFHVDALVYEREVQFQIASGYGAPPLEVSHGGGIFSTRILERDSPVTAKLLELNAQVLKALGLVRGASHSEYIVAHDGTPYFLETSARVGGAHIAELIEAATGLNMWAEWAKIEVAGGKSAYEVKPHHHEYAGLIVSLARQQHPDLSGYNDPEVVWNMDKEHHAGIIVRSPDPRRVQDLLASYIGRFREDFHAALPPQEKATH